MHRRRDVWENADSFDPSRWEGDNPKSIPTGAYVPFGAGVRRCIGEQMALYEMLAVIVLLLRSFSFRVAEGAIIDDEWALTLSMSHGLPMEVSRRIIS
jgi:cytochrome P450